jgi:thiamine biosynthesis protein ThiI
VIKTTAEMNRISQHAVRISKQMITKEKSFALRVTRTGQHEFTSQDVAIHVGDAIRKATKARVDLTNPDFELFIEIRGATAFLFLEKCYGTGGLPLGTQGNVIALLDDPHSLLASWYIMKRGCRPIFVTTDTHTMSAIQSFTAQWNIDAEIVVVPQGKNRYEQLKNITVDHNCYAVVTGHSLYTPHSLSAIKTLKEYISYPILSPLLAMDTKEIHQKCNDVGIPLWT